MAGSSLSRECGGRRYNPRMGHASLRGNFRYAWKTLRNLQSPRLWKGGTPFFVRDRKSFLSNQFRGCGFHGNRSA
ncbi:hypothetical protein E0E50_12290 [Azotobacter chroococcum subsp. isscasi]|nr:hypothetical protein E0E50_12290 [Azotobacter chroococcum subsp. isscasi]